jgi:hypothetical protein
MQNRLIEKAVNKRLKYGAFRAEPRPLGVLRIHPDIEGNLGGAGIVRENGPLCDGSQRLSNCKGSLAGDFR